MTRFTFDAPVSATSSAYEKVNRRHSDSRSDSSPFAKFQALRTRKALRRSKTGGTSVAIPQLQPTVFEQGAELNGGVASSSPLLNLPSHLRKRIYAHVYEHGAPVVHILMKRGSSNSNTINQSEQSRIAYRCCPALGNPDDCALANCRRFLDGASGCYFGSFDRGIGALLLTCRQLYVHPRTLSFLGEEGSQPCRVNIANHRYLWSRNGEATPFLYQHHTFNFDHPLSFLLFAQTISPTSLNAIRYVSFEPQRDLYTCRMGSSTPNNASSMDAWSEMWHTLANMARLEELSIRVRSPLSGSIAQKERKSLDSAREIAKSLRVFHFEAPWVISEPDQVRI